MKHVQQEVFMKHINIQFLVTEEEYALLQVEADQCGLTVPLYVKGKVLQHEDFGTYYQQLLDKVEKLPKGTKFCVHSVFGVEWTMRPTVKRSLGRIYFNRVDSGILANVRPIGKDSSRVMWYEKI